MMKRKNSSQKKFQEEMTARELLKTDINNISDQEFRIIVTRLIIQLEKSIEGAPGWLSRLRVQLQLRS